MRFIIFILLLLSVNVFASQSKTDSLLNILKNVKHDTARVNILAALCNEFRIDTAIQKSFEYGQKGIALAQQTGYTKGLAVCFNSVGDVYYQESGYDSARVQYDKALVQWKILADSKDIQVLKDAKQGIALVMLNKARIYVELFDKAKALDYYLKSLKLYEEVNDKKNKALVVTAIADNIYMDADYMRTLDYYFKSLKLYEEMNDKQNVGRAWVNIGWSYMNLSDAELIKKGINPIDRYSTALQCQLKSIKTYEEIDDKVSMANPLENIGWIYQSLTDSACMKMGLSFAERYTKALQYEFDALRLVEKGNDTYTIGAVWSSIAVIYFKQQQYSNALKYAGKTLQVGSEMGYMDVEKDAQFVFYQTYKALGNTSKALYHHEQYIALGDSIVRMENQKEITHKEFLFDFEKRAVADSIKNIELQKVKDAQIQAQQAQLKQEQTQRYALYGGLTLVIIFSFALFNRFRVIRHQKKIIERQKQLVENKNRDITDSIEYAKYIQESLLLSEEEINKILPYESLVFYQPKDVVSGDFYWLSSANNNGNPVYIIAAADCTGHGVPGAFLSMMGNMLLNEIVNEKHIINPALILKEIHSGIVNSLHKENESKVHGDGMDIALCVIDPANRVIQYAGAISPLYIVRKQNAEGKEPLEVIKGDLFSLGGKAGTSSIPSDVFFTCHTIPMEKDMTMYLFSDGYMDQFNSIQKLRFGSARFRNLLVESAHLPMREQKENLIKTFEDWRGTGKQIDDILVLGLRL